jgi:hypothetical protein
MPDYEIILWDTNRFDIHSVPFVEQACAAKKWAFAADYIRWYALYTEGGIYLDSDIKVYRNFDKFLNDRVFSGNLFYAGFSQEGRTAKQYWIEAECLGAEKGHPCMKTCMDKYENTEFHLINRIPCMGIASEVLTKTCLPFGYIPQKIEKPLYLEEGIVIYPEKYFAYYNRPLSLTKTHAIHICSSSWNESDFKYKQDFLLPLRKWHDKMMYNYWWFKRIHKQRKECTKKYSHLLGDRRH